MVPFSGMCDGASSLNGLSTIGFCTERVVRFMIVIPTERLSIKDVEFLVRERLLAFVTIEAVAVIFAFELPICGRDSLLLDRSVAPSALDDWKGQMSTIEG